jgi:hypothetical protein
LRQPCYLLASRPWRSRGEHATSYRSCSSLTKLAPTSTGGFGSGNFLTLPSLWICSGSCSYGLLKLFCILIFK